MPITATVTAKFGPDRQATAAVLTNINGMLVQPDRKVIQFYANTDEPGVPVREFDLTGVATFTVVITGNNWVVTIS